MIYFIALSKMFIKLIWFICFLLPSYPIAIASACHTSFMHCGHLIRETNTEEMVFIIIILYK